jgi:serine/threonine protein kinase
MSVEAAWYEDPRDSSRMRYWNGSAWTEHVRALRVQERIEGIILGDVVGSGSTAEVRRGRQPALDRDVAVKIIASNLDEAAKTRFQREQMAMGRLSAHPWIVPVYEAGLSSASRPYIVMPYLPGSIAAELIAGGPMPAAEAAALMAKVCDAVEFAHENGVLHRDIKPGNILRSPIGDPMITDFGIAQFGADDNFASNDSALTPLYAAPEVMAGHGATASADVYSLGATLFTLLAGAPAFSDGQRDLETIRVRVATESVERPHTPMPDALWAVVVAAMDKQPGRRPAGSAAFGDLLRSAADAPLPPSAGPQVDLAPVVETKPDASVAVGERSAEPLTSALSPRVRRLAVVLATLLLVAVIVVVMLLVDDDQASLPANLDAQAGEDVGRG